MKSYPLDPLYFAKLGDKAGKVSAVFEILAVAGNVLSNEDKLLGAALSKSLCLIEDIFHLS